MAAALKGAHGGSSVTARAAVSEDAEPGGPMQSEQALGHAGDIVEFVRQALADA